MRILLHRGTLNSAENKEQCFILMLFVYKLQGGWGKEQQLCSDFTELERVASFCGSFLILCISFIIMYLIIDLNSVFNS